MSETDALGERTYVRLKSDLLHGAFSVHIRLDFAELAHRYAVSTTPIREAAMRLLGEDLLEFHPKGGLRPRFDKESDLRALLELQGQLAALALRWSARISMLEASTASVALDRSRNVLATLMRATGNAELVRVMERLGDRLEPYRRLDGRLLPDTEGELEAIEAAGMSAALLGPLLRRYHRRRLALIPRYLMLAATTGETNN